MSGLSDPTLEVLGPIAAWHEQHVSGDVTFRRLPVPEDDDYGLELVGAFEPLRPDACPVEIGITTPSAGSCVYAFLDKWAHIAERLGLTVPDSQKGRVGLYVEPIPLSGERLLELLRAIAAGRVHLQATGLRGRLAATSGWVELQHERFPMRGVGEVPTLLPRLGIGKTTRLSYAPWFSAEPADDAGTRETQ